MIKHPIALAFVGILIFVVRIRLWANGGVIILASGLLYMVSFLWIAKKGSSPKAQIRLRRLICILAFCVIVPMLTLCGYAQWGPKDSPEEYTDTIFFLADISFWIIGGGLAATESIALTAVLNELNQDK